MELYCTKHKKKLSERLTDGEYISLYCVHCKMDKLSNEKEAQQRIVLNKLSIFSHILIVFITVFVFYLLNKVIYFLLALLLIIPVFNFVRRTIRQLKVWTFQSDDQSKINLLRAQILNESSIQANKVEQKKRQWKKEYMQHHCVKKLDMEKWEKYLRRFYEIR
ncbi:hypothetical protein ACWE42_13860 [Sutcliffiella cohnii]